MHLLRPGPPKPSKWAELFLKILATRYDKYPGEMANPEFGLDSVGLAVASGVIDKKSVREAEESWQQGDDFAMAGGVPLADVHEAVKQMKQRGWIELQRRQWDSGHRASCWVPTAKGIDHAHQSMRPLWVKLFDYFKGHIQTIVVSVITSVITAVATYFVLRALGVLD